MMPHDCETGTCIDIASKDVTIQQVETAEYLLELVTAYYETHR